MNEEYYWVPSINLRDYMVGDDWQATDQGIRRMIITQCAVCYDGNHSVIHSADDLIRFLDVEDEARFKKIYQQVIEEDKDLLTPTKCFE